MSTTLTLNEIMNSGRSPNIRKGLGYIQNFATHQTTKFVSSSAGTSSAPYHPRYILRKYTPICHYCRTKGHTRPEYFKFYRD